MFWGAVGMGYCAYGWKQKATIPLVAGIAMSVIPFVIQGALPMSLICIALMVGVWWLVRQGY